MSYIQKQHHLGLSGLALLRSWLVKKNSDIQPVLANMYEMLNELSSNNFKSNEIDAEEFDTSNGYGRWSETYDGPNLLVDVEESDVISLLNSLPKGKALDAGCGTGRYSLILKSLGNEVTGVDQSAEMLEKAKAKDKEINFVQGSIDSLSFKDDSFDTITCTLALTHFKDLDKPVSELIRVTKKGGYLVLSDINPWFIALGAHADFNDKDGKWGFVPNYVHWHSEYLKLFRKYGLEIIECKEPLIKSSNLTVSDSDDSITKETLDLALKGLPLALIWLLKKN